MLCIVNDNLLKGYRMSRAKKNAHYLSLLLDSLRCGVNKAINGSDVEDGYIIGKLRVFAGAMGYKLVKS